MRARRGALLGAAAIAALVVAPLVHAWGGPPETGEEVAGANGTAWKSAEAWPARFGREPKDVPQGVVIEFTLDGQTVWRSVDAVTARGLDLWNARQDGARLVAEGKDAPWFVEAGEGGFGMVRVVRRPTDKPDDPRPAAAMMFVSGQQGSEQHGPRPQVVLERTWFSLYDPTKGPARGVAVVMPGLFGTPEAVFDQSVRHLQSRGWIVLRMMAQPTRYTEKLRVEVDPEDPSRAAATLAEVFDQRVAECAYAVEAALGWLVEKRPEARGLPRAILGGSGGAMSLPTVVARMPGAFSAAVMIAGGADFATIAATSNYVDWVDSVRITWPGGMATAAQREALGRAYLERSKLDSFHTASALEGVPTLVLHATRDKAVPAAQGDLLWTRLGKPERWEYVMGHEMIFISLPFRLASILDWLDANVASKKGERDADAGGGS